MPPLEGEEAEEVEAPPRAACDWPVGDAGWANKTPWYMMPLISMETTNEESNLELPSSVVGEKRRNV